MLVREQLFLMEEYEKKPVFASFLPGINGWKGIPLWCFYVNRGQCITSFGTMDKEHSIMEFYPAHQAYQRTQDMGFRTFLKIDGVCTEAFTNRISEKNMLIGKNELCIEETDAEHEISVKIRYTTLPEEPLGALMRSVEVQNFSGKRRKLEVLDGMPELIPYGVSLESMKEMAQTAKAWMEVLDHEKKTPRFKVRASMQDTAQVSKVEEFHFALGTCDSKLLPVVVSKETLFGYDTALRAPVNFYVQGAEELCTNRQMTQNEVPCCFFALERELAPGEALKIQEVYGMSRREEEWKALAENMQQEEYFEQKQARANVLAEDLTDAIATQTGHPVFDEYCRQSYLDNLLRGGYPIRLGNHIFYVYSRKHGDIERDYNFFTMYPESYSQGNGNFRDVNQNRRCDVQFAPFVGDKDIKYFYNCIQMNGYNPLGIEKSVYELPEGVYPDIISGSFTPGQLYDAVCKKVSGKKEQEELFLAVMNAANDLNETRFIEGYWTDHWTYNLDLVESYLEIYPEREQALLFGDRDYTCRQSEAAILPRRERYVKTEQGIRQYHFLKELPAGEKYVKEESGQTVCMTLAEKLFLLSVLKTAALDPYGMGIEMEGGKPGWYDALNGLPGLFGSSMAETYELERMLHFLIQKLEAYEEEMSVPEELWGLASLIKETIVNQEEEWRAAGFHPHCWNAVNDAKETYWKETERSICGTYHRVSAKEALGILTVMEQMVSCGIQRAMDIGGGLAPTYFSYEVTAYEEDDGIHPTAFALREIPFFLEGAVRAMKLPNTKEARAALYTAVKESGLYDKKLQMYKVNESLKDASFELGRAKAFTPGWLENESIWLHMEYKYLLELLKNGMYEKYEEDFQNAAVPFLKEEVYGRSLFENSSFIVSSDNPNPSIHGKGFVARLSGSTAEFLQMWQIMMFGRNAFTCENGELKLTFAPMIPHYLIGGNRQIRARFLGTTEVVYLLPDAESFLPGEYKISSYKLFWKEESEEETETLTGRVAERIRDGEALQIEVKIQRI